MAEMKPSHPPREPRDLSHIDIDDAAALQWWCDHLLVTADDLRKAVKEVGPVTTTVRKRLGKRPIPLDAPT